MPSKMEQDGAEWSRMEQNGAECTIATASKADHGVSLTANHYLDGSNTPLLSNYGNKLKRGAEYISEGKLDIPKGSSSYAQVSGI
jgi:hypothetical protein